IWAAPARRCSFVCMSAVLIAEPEADIRGFLVRHLTDDGFDVLGADDGTEALELAARSRPDLVLLGDASALDGFTDVPVIVIGDAQADAVDRVRAFARGCDDFVGRPFHYDELVARIRAVLRRTSPSLRDRLEAGSIAVDLVTRRATVHGRTVTLPAKEYDLLAKLATEPERVFTKEQLLREVWGYLSLGRTRTLDSHASRLRRKLRQAGAGPCVVNIWGV